MKRLFLVCLAAMIPCLGLAENAACGQYFCSGQIQTLYVTMAGDIYVRLVGGFSGVTCTPSGGAYATLQTSSPNLRPMYATLLTAQMTGRPVTLRFVDGSAGCTIQYVTMP